MKKNNAGVLSAAFAEAETIAVCRIMSDTSSEWTPSENFEIRMDRILRPKEREKRNSADTVYKRVACAALCLAAVFGVAVGVKAIRDPIADFFGKNSDKSEMTTKETITTAGAVSSEAETDATVESGPVKVSYMQFTGKGKFIDSDTSSPFYRDLYDRIMALDWGKAILEEPTKKEESPFYDYIMCDASIEFGEGDDVESYGISIVDSETYYLVHSIEHKETGKYISYYFVLKPTDPDGLFGVISQLVN